MSRPTVTTTKRWSILILIRWYVFFYLFIGNTQCGLVVTLKSRVVKRVQAERMAVGSWDGLALECGTERNDVGSFSGIQNSSPLQQLTEHSELYSFLNACSSIPMDSLKPLRRRTKGGAKKRKSYWSHSRLNEVTWEHQLISWETRYVYIYLEFGYHEWSQIHFYENFTI